jgi:hypothetical protein
MIDKMREEFEAWAITSAWLGLSDECMEFIDDGYVNCEVQAAWLAWQASREALVIEWPQIVAYEAGYDSIRENEFASDSGELFDADEVFALHRSIEVLEAIEAAGLKVKP